MSTAISRCQTSSRLSLVSHYDKSNCGSHATLLIGARLGLDHFVSIRTGDRVLDHPDTDEVHVKADGDRTVLIGFRSAHGTQAWLLANE